LVSSSAIERVRRAFFEVDEHQVELRDYQGATKAALFELVTGQSFLAGIATRILNREGVPEDDRAALVDPFLLPENRWRRPFGPCVDLTQPELVALARALERLRDACFVALSN
jgi:hypothetical protein